MKITKHIDEGQLLDAHLRYQVLILFFHDGAILTDDHVQLQASKIAPKIKNKERTMPDEYLKRLGYDKKDGN